LRTVRRPEAADCDALRESPPHEIRPILRRGTLPPRLQQRSAQTANTRRGPAERAASHPCRCL